MYKNQRGFAIVYILLVIALAIISALAVSTALRQPNRQGGRVDTKQADSQLVGVAFTPRDFSISGINDFYTQAAMLGNSISWHGDWAELSDSAKAPWSIAKTAAQKGLKPIILIGTHSERNGQSVAIRPLSTQTQADYLKWAVEFTRVNQPRYFGIGNEVNTIARSAPTDYQELVKLFNKVAVEIRKVSPETQVFVTFQLERLKGLNGGLFGGQNNLSDAQWNLLDDFDADLLAFTTYPGLIYRSVSDIPAGYYSDISNHTDKPIAFSEVGWSAAKIANDWESDPDQQGQFADLFLDQTQTLKPSFRTWLLLYDQQTAPAFKSMGLIGSTGKRPAFDVWRKGTQ